MNGRVQTHAAIVNGITPKYLLVEVIGSASTVVGFVYRYVIGWGISLTTNQYAREARAVFGIEGCAALLTSRCH
jgi:hypothetical protein